MDLVSNFIGNILPNQISTSGLGIPHGFNLEDNTFAELLEKQMETAKDNLNSIPQNLNIQVGLNIGDFDSVNPVLGIQKVEPVNQINNTQETSMFSFKDVKDMTTSEVLTFVTSLFDNKPNLTQNDNDNGLFNFERKLAASSYGKYAKELVTDLQDFVADALKLS